MSASLVRQSPPAMFVARPALGAAVVGFCAGWGTYVLMRLLGERLLVNVLVPVFLLVPLFGMALAPVLRERSWLRRPGVATIALVALAAVVADSAHVFYFPSVKMFPGSARAPEHRYGLDVLLLLLASPFPFLLLGQLLGRVLEAGARPARLAALESATFAAGTAFGFLGVRFLGGYEAFLLFVAFVAPLVGVRWLASLVVVSTLVAAGWVRTKPPSFFTWELTDYQWKDTVWSPNQKLDVVTYGTCSAYMYNNFLFFYACPEKGTELNDVRDLSVELGKRLPVRTIINLGSAAGLTPFTLLGAYPQAERYYAIEIERQILDWARNAYQARGGEIYDDPRVVALGVEGRQFLESSDVKADFVFVDGVDTPFITSQIVPIARDAWFFTLEGYRSIFDHLTDDGYMIIEHGGNTPGDFARLLKAAPPDAKTTAVWYVNTTYPMVGMPHFWIALTKSERTYRAIREAFQSVPNASLVDPMPIVAPGRVPTDDRPILFTTEAIYVAEAAIPLLLMSVVLFTQRRVLGRMPGRTRWPFVLAGMGGSLLQLATVTSLARGYPMPATAMVGLLVANLAGASFAAWLAQSAFEARVRLGAAIDRFLPELMTTLAVVSAMAVAALTVAVASPFVNHALAMPATVLAAFPSAFVWTRALAAVPPGDRRLALGFDLLGGVIGATVAPALIAVDGYKVLVLGGSLCVALGAWLLWIGDVAVQRVSSPAHPGGDPTTAQP